MKTLKQLVTLALPVLFSASCGGENGGNQGACPAGVTVYRVADGAYQSAASNVTETCNLGLTAAEISTPRTVVNDTGTGTVTILSADGTVILGTGPVRCNSGSLTFSGTLNNGTNCEYKSERSSQLTANGDNDFTLSYTETRSNWMPFNGMNCNMTAPCSIQFSLKMKK